MVIELRGVAKRYGNDSAPAVQELNLAVKQGEILSILGPSGCGKTTTLRLIAGLERPDAGEIVLGGKTVASPDVFVSPEKRSIGLVFQDLALFPHMTVKENVGFGLHGFERERRDKIVNSMLALVGLHGMGERYPHQLSGGQQQRVALARALAPCPIVVLLDEPFSNLDADMRVQMRAEVHGILHRAKATAIFVTHDQEEAFSMADRVAVMREGRLEQVDIPERIYHAPATKFVADFVGQADFIKGKIRGGVIATEIGEFSNTTLYDEGTEVELMIRPDDIDIVQDDSGVGIVVSRQFRGSENIYAVRLPSGDIAHSSQSSTVVYKEGTRVRVYAKPTHIVIFLNGQVAAASRAVLA